MPPFLNNPLPSSMRSECKKCGRILASFIDPRQAFGPDKIIPPSILAKAKGLAVITVFKAGFLGSGRFGSGVVVARLSDGTWSAPSAIGTVGGGFGGQIGFELTDFVFILNDSNAVKTFAQVGSLTLGGNVSIAAGPVGMTAEASGAASLKSVSGVFAYSKSKGLFAGISLEGSVLIERRDANEKMYGQKFTARQLLGGSVPVPPQAEPLMHVLKSRVFAGVGGSFKDDGMYNDVPVYDDAHEDVGWQGQGPGRTGTGLGEGSRGTRAGSMSNAGGGGDDYVYQDKPSRAATWQDDPYDRASNRFGRANPNETFDRLESARARSSTMETPADYSYSDRKGPAPGRPAAPKPVFGQKTGAAAGPGQAVAKFTFDADQPGDLGFKKGEVITIVKRTDNDTDWWTGRIGSREGIFPSNYVEVVGHTVHASTVTSGTPPTLDVLFLPDERRIGLSSAVPASPPPSTFAVAVMCMSLPGHRQPPEGPDRFQTRTLPHHLRRRLESRASAGAHVAHDVPVQPLAARPLDVLALLARATRPLQAPARVGPIYVSHGAIRLPFTYHTLALAPMRLSVGLVGCCATRDGGAGEGHRAVSRTRMLFQPWTMMPMLLQISPYRDNDERFFGVDDIGLPDGCQIEQVHSLQRHAQRFPTGGFDDGVNNENLAAKVYNWTVAHPDATFTGPLAFLNTYRYQMGRSYLTNIGATTEFQAGATFWNRYGRTLYNATVGQLQYNATYQNLTARPKPVLRTTGQSRIENSQINWALGFFGPSFYETPIPDLDNFVNGSLFDVVIIPEGGTENNTLASYDSCFADDITTIGSLGDLDLIQQYVPLYIGEATARVNQYAPAGFRFSDNDTYAMQSICAYENGYLGQSDFCTLFTADEWAGFEQTLDIEYYYDYSFGNPTGRAQGLGYQQELLARLTNQYITSSNSSVNSSLTDNPAAFPLGRPFYADFTHDDIIISTLTSMSVDYFREHPNLQQYPPDPNRHFILSHLTPFGARLITEVVGCASATPAAVHDHRTAYTPSQYGYDPANAPHKFLRMRLNNALVPLDTIRTGECLGRTDGLCPLPAFLASQYTAQTLANYDFACFANYSIIRPTNGNDYDGTIDAQTGGIVLSEGTLTAEYIESL
nr:sh3 domain-containing protein [Quercus suber]